MPKCFCLLFILLFSVSNLQAHPHTFIDLETSFNIDKEGQITGIYQVWIFDEFYSAMFIADMLTEYGPDEDIAFIAAADNMVESLFDFSYFSNLSQNGVIIRLPLPETYSLSRYQTDEIENLKMEMYFQFSEPVQLPNREIEWSVYDPTYYVAMNHNDPVNVNIDNNSVLSCDINFNVPKPSQETIDYAISLDRDQRDTDGLGIIFAEKITLNCT